MTITRRDFLASLAGAAGGLALSRVPFRRLAGMADIPPHVSAPEAERWVASACLLCPGGCGIDVRLLDGSPVKIRGNPLHPINRGGLCAVGQEGLHVLYHPDRIRSPHRRVGAPGGDEWVKISWEEAIAEVARRLGEILAAGKPESIVLLDGFGRGLMTRLLGRFMRAVGSPNHVLDLPPSGLSAMMHLAQGIASPPAYDLENSEYILSFGAPLLEGWRSPIQGQRAYAGLRGAGGRRGRLVQVDTRESLTATRADRWVQVKPGGHGALALSMAYVIIKNNLYDRDFIDRHAFGFENWTDESGVTRRGFKETVLQHYRPVRMEDATGVPADVVLTIAKEFARAPAAVAVVDHGATMVSNGVQTALAVQALNALVGSIDREGGTLVGEGVPFAEWPPLPGEGPSAKGRIDGAGDRFPLSTDSVASIPHAILGQEADVQALFLYYSNPSFSTPDPERFERALARIPFKVSFTPFWDDTSRHADLVLPDHTYLERWQDAVGPDSYPYSVLGITRPAIEPLYDTRHTGDVILETARRVGGAVSEAFPWKSFREALEGSVRGVFEAQRGTALANEIDSVEVRQREMGGWWLPKHKKFEPFWSELTEKGGWWDPAYVYRLWGRVFRTASGKYEFGEQALVRLARERAGGGPDDPDRIRKALDTLGIRAEVDQAFLPHHEEPLFQGGGGEPAFTLNLFRPLVPNSGLVPDMPWVREILNPRVAWDTWAEIHPGDAERLGIEDGEWVEIVSAVGRIGVRALIGREAAAGVVNVPWGLGRKVAGRWGVQRGANPNVLIPGTPEGIDPLAGVPLSLSVKVRIERVGEEVGRG